jgi:hypothetical protein
MAGLSIAQFFVVLAGVDVTRVLRERHQARPA